MCLIFFMEGVSRSLVNLSAHIYYNEIMKKDNRGIFIVLEGLDRTGKSTHGKKIVKYLLSKKFKTVYTREPGGTKFTEGIRKLLLDPKHKVIPMAELMLYTASRAQHTQEKIIPALKQGKMVLCERYTMSTTVYQGYGRKLPLKIVDTLNKIATFGIKPDLTIVFDMPLTHFKTRSKGFKSDRLERENLQFKNRIRKAYLHIAKKTTGAVVIDTNKPIAVVQSVLRKKIDTLLKKYKK